MVASQPSPSRSRLCASYSNVENVVYAPVKPTATSSRKSSACNQPPSLATNRPASTAENQPRNRLPVILIRKVPQGKAVSNSRPTPTETPQRARPPSADPSDTRPICASSLTASSISPEKENPVQHPGRGRWQ